MLEYPTAGAQSQGFTALLAELRAGLNAHASKKGDSVPYQLSVRKLLEMDVIRR